MRDLLDWRWSFRLLPPALRELRVRPCGVLHIGAHHGEEVPVYQECGFESITLVEADPECCAIIAGMPWISDPRVGIVNRACVAPGGPARATFHRAESTAFSGLVRDKRQPEQAAFTVETITVGDLQLMCDANVLVVDTQGTEMDVLAGIRHLPLDLIVVESQSERRGAPGAYLPDLQEWAHTHGWAIHTRWLRANGWADTLLIPARMGVPA